MRSIRFTLTLWYVGLLAVILSLFSAVLYFTVASSLTRDVEQTLALQAKGIEENVYAYWRAERAQTGAGPGNWIAAPSQTFEGAIEQGELSALLERWAQRTGHLATERPVRLISRQGQPLAASPEFEALVLPLTDTIIAQAWQTARDVLQTVERPEAHIRLLTHPVLAGGRVLYGVQIAADLRREAGSLARLRAWLVILIPVTLVVTGAASLLLATSVLWPLRQVVAGAQGFIAEHLHERLNVPSTSDEVVQLLTSFNDMTGRLERAFRRLRQFSAGASHELRTSLTVMKGEISLALRKPRGAEEYQRVLRAHLEAVGEMTQIVEELLTLAQTEAAEKVLERRPVELSALARRTGERFTELARSNGARLEVSCDGELWLHGDQRLLERLIANLVDNAIKHTPAGGVISLLTASQDQDARLIVSDTGEGIPPEVLPHLFDQFFKRTPSGDRSGASGLGLGLCRWIVETHHGYLDVASAPGHGTIFTVRLPLLSPSAARSA